MNIEPFTEKLKEQIVKGLKKIHVKDQISGLTYAELSITSLDDEFLHPAKPISDIKFRFQTLISGAMFIPGNYRLDNCHGEMHSHFQGDISAVHITTLNDAFLMMCGSSWRKEDE